MFLFCNNEITIVVVVVIGVLSLPSASTGVFDKHRSNGECFRPGGGRGICRNINDCEPLRNLLIKSKSRPRPWVIDFLKRSHCGFEGKDPVVCCSLPPKPKEIDLKINVTVKNPFVERFSNKSCGSLQTLDKVIGGTTTGRHEFPWMALIGYKTSKFPFKLGYANKHSNQGSGFKNFKDGFSKWRGLNDTFGFGIQFRCGGSLISSRYVLTAAHCVTTLKDIYPTSVRLGEYDFGTLKDCDDGKECGSTAKDIPIEMLIPHPEYYKAELRNDIALIRLAKSVEFKECRLDVLCFCSAIRPVCLPLDEQFRERSLVDNKAVIAGWGTTESGTNSDVLRKVTLPIVPLSECSKIYKRKIPITESQICAGGEAGRDSCSGDSGGPLQILDLNPLGEPAYIQHGIVSFGPRICGTKGMPGVYTKVAYYADWILKNMKE